jgi:hypothetical protein
MTGVRVRVRLARRPWRSKNWSPTPHDPQAAHWGAGDQFFLPWAKDSICKGRRLNWPTLLGLSALFDPLCLFFLNKGQSVLCFLNKGQSLLCFLNKGQSLLCFLNKGQSVLCVLNKGQSLLCFPKNTGNDL